MILTKREKSKIRYIKKVICVIEHNDITRKQGLYALYKLEDASQTLRQMFNCQMMTDYIKDAKKKGMI